MKFKIKTIPEKINGTYIGMNAQAAKHHLHLKDYPGNNVIEVYKKESPKMRSIIIRHEKVEYGLMSKHHQYRYAHKRALQEEKTKLPIKEVLRRYG